MLVDAGVTFDLTTLSFEEWTNLQQAPDFHDHFPYGGLPVLEVKEEGKPAFVLAETGAILAYLQQRLHPEIYIGVSLQLTSNRLMGR